MTDWKPIYWRVRLADGRVFGGVWGDLKTLNGAFRRLKRRWQDEIVNEHEVSFEPWS
jgi:hypothetical protein